MVFANIFRCKVIHFIILLLILRGRIKLKFYMLKFVKIFCVFFFVFLAKISVAQKDVIITQAGEEIRCKILDETPTRFKYAYVGPHNKVLRNEIFKNLVSSFKYGYYDTDILKNEKAIVKTPIPVNPVPRVDTREAPVKKSDFKAEPKETEQKKTEVKVTPKESKTTPKVPEKDLVRDLNKPSYPVNNQAKPIEPIKTAEPAKTIEPIKKEIASVVVDPIKNEVKKEEVIKTQPKTVEVKTEVKPKAEVLKPEIIEKTTPIKTEPVLTKTPKEIEKPIIEAAPKVTDTKVVEKTTPPKKEQIKNEAAVVAKPVEIKPIEKTTEVIPKEVLSDRIPGKVKETPKKAEIKIKEEEPKEMAKLDQAKSTAGYKNFMRFRVGLKGGLGNIANKTSDTSPFGLYQEKLQRGWILGGDVSYFVKDWLGLGIKYASFQTNNSSTKLDFPNPISQDAIKNGAISNKVSHKFIGPTVLVRKAIDFKTYIVLTASPGLNLYSDKGVLNKDNFKLTGQSYGGNATVGLDFLLGNDIFGRDIILSIEGGYNYGSINGLTVGATGDKKTLTSAINLNRFDFGVGLRFTRFPMYLR
jgi:hypothetical protein